MNAATAQSSASMNRAADQRREQLAREIYLYVNGLRLKSEKGQSNLAQLLDVMSRFHRYSLGNQLLIATQNPEAEGRVAGMRTWNNLGRRIKTGAKAIWVWAPAGQQGPGIDELRQLDLPSVLAASGAANSPEDPQTWHRGAVTVHLEDDHFTVAWEDKEKQFTNNAIDLAVALYRERNDAFALLRQLHKEQQDAAPAAPAAATPPQGAADAMDQAVEQQARQDAGARPARREDNGPPRFRLVKVFDIGQTEGDELEVAPEAHMTLSPAERETAFLEALTAALGEAGVEVAYNDGPVDNVADMANQRIFIDQNQPFSAKFQTLAGIGGQMLATRKLVEAGSGLRPTGFERDAIRYILCRRYKMNSPVPAQAVFQEAGDTSDQVRERLALVGGVSKGLVKSMEAELEARVTRAATAPTLDTMVEATARAEVAAQPLPFAPFGAPEGAPAQAAPAKAEPAAPAPEAAAPAAKADAAPFAPFGTPPAKAEPAPAEPKSESAAPAGDTPFAPFGQPAGVDSAPEPETPAKPAPKAAPDNPFEAPEAQTPPEPDNPFESDDLSF